MLKLKKSGKIVLIIAAVLVFIGIVFSIIGVVKGPTFWIIADTNGLHTGKNVEILKDNKDVDPFTAIEINNSEVPIKLVDGDKFAIKYHIAGLYTKLDYKVENSVLKIDVISTEKDVDNYYCFIDTKRDFSYLDNENYLEITIPTGTVIDLLSIENPYDISEHNYDWRYNVEYVIENVTVNNISSDKATSYNSSIRLNNSNVSNFNTKLFYNIYVENSNIENLISESPYESVKDLLQINNSKIKSLTTLDGSGYDSINISNSTIEQGEFYCNDFQSINLIANGVTVDCNGEITMKNTTINSYATLNSFNDIKFSTATPQNEFNYNFLINRNGDNEDGEDFDEFADFETTTIIDEFYDETLVDESEIYYDEDASFIIINGKKQPQTNLTADNGSGKTLTFKSSDGNIRVNFK